MSVLDTLPHLCTAKKRVRTKDTLGGTKDSYATIFEDRPCWRQPANNAEVSQFQKRTINVTHKVYFRSNPQLDNSHILVMGGDVMKVQSSAPPDCSVGMGILWKVMVEQYGGDVPL